jgi:hypothetical protein
MNNEHWFEQLARIPDADPLSAARAPATLKSRIYSSVVNQLAAGGRLLSLTATKAEGRQLCVFESALTLLPIDERMRERNPCRVCHARVLGEHVDHAPIFWPGCPYSDFHHG